MEATKLIAPKKRIDLPTIFEAGFISREEAETFITDIYDAEIVTEGDVIKVYKSDQLCIKLWHNPGRVVMQHMVGWTDYGLASMIYKLSTKRMYS